MLNRADYGKCEFWLGGQVVWYSKDNTIITLFPIGG